MKYIEIFFDTNIIKSSNNYSEVNFGSNYTSFVDFLGTNDLVDKCKLNFSRIVLREYSKQVKESYAKDKELLKKFKSINEDIISIENEFIQNIESKVEDYVKKECANIVEIPVTSESYLKIIERAINKEKPFCGNQGNSDKGFKDAIQWESILAYALENESEEYVLITANTNDFTDILEKEFEKITSKHIKIFPNVGEAQKYILSLNQTASKYDMVKFILDEKFDNNEIIPFVADLCDQYDFSIEDIDSIGNIVDLGNGFYSFFIYTNDEQKNMYKVDCKLIENDLIAKDMYIAI